MADPVSIAINVALIAANMALTASQEFEGPRLDSLSVTTSDYGAPINYVHGIRRLDGVSCIWAEPLREVKRRRKTKGGKFNDYTYFGTWAVAVCDHAADAITRIWFDRNLIYDATGAGPISPFAIGDTGGGLVGGVIDELGIGDISQYITMYLGSDDQEPDARIAATVDAEFGEGSTPAYRGVTYIVFKDLPLEKLGNRLPQVSVEVVTSAADEFPYEERTAGYQSSVWTSFSPDGKRAYWTQQDDVDPAITYVEIWDITARAPMVLATYDDDVLTPFHALGTDALGRIYTVAGGNSALAVLDADASAIIKTVGPPDISWGANYADFPFIGDIYVFGSIAYCTSFSTEKHGWIYTYPGDNATLWEAYEGSDAFQWKFVFADAYGGVWALGGSGDLAEDQLVIRRLVAGADSPTTAATAVVTMPIFNGAAAAVLAGFHCQQDGEDYIIVRFGGGDGCVVRLDWETLSVQGQIVGDGTAAFDAFAASSTRPGARTLWLGGLEWDFVAMAVVRDVDAEDYDPSFPSDQTTFYDRINKALIRVSGDAEMQWLYLDRISGDGVTLRSIVEAVSERAGLSVDAGDIEATDLTQLVPGYSWTQGQGKAILEPLLEAYDSEVRPHDFAVQFLRRGTPVLGTIPVTDMGAGGTVRYDVSTVLDSDLPLKANMTFADLDRDQQPNTAIAQRSSAATDGRRELSIDASTLALDADTGRPMIEGFLRRAWMKAQSAKTSLTRAWTKLEPADAYTLALDDFSRAFKLVRLEFGANGVLTTEWERYAPSVHTASSLLGAPADGLIPDEVPVFGYTKGLFLDIPLVQDADDDLIGYLAAAPYSDTAWPGATFYRSDDGEAFEDELGSVASTQQAVIGSAMSALPDALATCWDNASVVTVKLFAGELTSATKAQVGNGANRALIGDEIIGFTTATLIAEKTYQLSGLHRGRRGTEWATGTHAAGDRFVLLDSLPQAEMGASDVGDTFYVRPTTSGGPAGFVQVLEPYTGASLKPYAPAHLAVEDDGGDLVVTWTRRTRIGGTWRDSQDVPLGEGSESYAVQVLDGSGVLVRNLGPVSSPTAVYEAADIAADAGAGETIRVMQVSTTVGNGFAADIAI
jgi:hypothetical protein